MTTGVSAVILAAGLGSRMGGTTPKQLLELNGERLIDRAIAPFIGWPDQAIVTVPDGSDITHESDQIEMVRGGATRAQSTALALAHVRYDRVLIHDAARPFVTPAILQDLVDALDAFACAYPVMPVVNSIVVDRDGLLAESPDREIFREVQTPQAFRTEILREAFTRFGGEHPHLPELVRRLGMPVKHVQGSPWLFKVTYPPSLYMAQYYVEHGEETAK